MSIQEMIERKDINGLVTQFLDAEDEECKAIISALKDPDSIDYLIGLLKDEDKRVNAAVVLGNMGEIAIGALSEALIDNEPQARLAAIRGLGLTNSPKAVPYLIASLKEESSIREKAIYFLGYIGDPTSIDDLLELLKDEDFNIRSKAVSAFGMMVTGMAYNLNKSAEDNERMRPILKTKVVNPLINLLEDEDPSVRSTVITTLASIDYTSSISHSIKAFEDVDQDVRKYASSAITQYHRGEEKQDAIEPLIEALGSRNKNVRELASYCLGFIGDARALGPLKERLNDGEYWVKERASEAIAKIERG